MIKEASSVPAEALGVQKSVEPIRLPEFLGEAREGLSKGNWREGKYVGRS